MNFDKTRSVNFFLKNKDFELRASQTLILQKVGSGLIYSVNLSALKPKVFRNG